MLLAEAVAAGVELPSVFVEPAAGTLAAVDRARRAGSRILEVQSGELARVLDLATPQSVVGVAVQRTASLDAVLEGAVVRARPVLALVGVQDPGNAGTLVRVAEAAGCAGVVFTVGSVDVHNPKTVRATAGAIFRVAVAEGIGAEQLGRMAAAQHLPMWATVRSGGVVLEEAPLGGPTVLLVGSEAHGLPDELRRSADGLVTIPMDGAVESLNAAVAGALVAFEAARQRRAPNPEGLRPGAEPGRSPSTAVGHDGHDHTLHGPSGRGGGPSDEERST